MSKPVIGLIGGIGSGKSRVAEAFASRGARVVDGDRIGHDALRDPDVRKQLVGRWGPGILDEKGEIVRRRVSEIVFSDEKERLALEDIVHPWIGRRIRSEIATAQNDRAVPFIVLDAAIMLETGWNSVCDRLVYVEVPREQRLQRIARQRRWTPEQVEAREGAQLPLTEKAARAHHVLDNSGTLEELKRQVDNLLREWNIGERGA